MQLICNTMQSQNDAFERMYKAETLAKNQGQNNTCKAIFAKNHLQNTYSISHPPSKLLCLTQYRLPYPTGYAYGTMVNGLYQNKGMLPAVHKRMLYTTHTKKK